MTPETPTPSRRPRLLGWSLLALLFAFYAWAGWRAHDERAALREAKAAGLQWQSREPFELIRANWRAAFRKVTWTDRYRRLYVGPFVDAARDPNQIYSLIRRIGPVELTYPRYLSTNLDSFQGLTGLHRIEIEYCPVLQNVDGLKGISSLQSLYLGGCSKLQNVDGLKGLSALQRLYLLDPALENVDALKELSALQELSLGYGPKLQNVDGLKDLSVLRELCLDGCRSLQNVDGLKGLRALKHLRLNGCDAIPPAALRELRAALPHTHIYLPDGSYASPRK